MACPAQRFNLGLYDWYSGHRSNSWRKTPLDRSHSTNQLSRCGTQNRPIIEKFWSGWFENVCNKLLRISVKLTDLCTFGDVNLVWRWTVQLFRGRNIGSFYTSVIYEYLVYWQQLIHLFFKYRFIGDMDYHFPWTFCGYVASSCVANQVKLLVVHKRYGATHANCTSRCL